MDDALSISQLLDKHTIPAAVQDELVGPPFNLDSVEKFANFFENAAEVRTLFVDQSTACNAAGDLSILASLRMAWREAEARTTQGVKRMSGDSPTINTEDPLPPEVEQGLRAAFARKHQLTIPSSWMGVPSLVGRLHRELKHRCMVLFPLHKLKSMDSASLSGPTTKRAKLTPQLELVVGGQEQASEITISSSFQYLLSLQELHIVFMN
eukprot:11503913-Karenia_brevis.AAC.1